MSVEAQNVSFDQSSLYAIAGDQVNNLKFYLHTSRSAFALLDDVGAPDQLRQTIANWLSPLDFRTRQDAIFQSRAEGTGQWFLESEIFQDWRDGTPKTLFCPGMPGAGKTVLMSIVINHLQTYLGHNDNVATAYVYFDHTQSAQQTLCNLMANLLKQLIQRPSVTLDDVNSLYLRYKDQNTRPSLSELTNAIDTEISKHLKFFLVFDALDELSETRREVAKLLNALESLTNPVKLMVTSRDLPSVAARFQDAIRLEIRAHDWDVRTYVGTRILRSYPTDLKETVNNEIVKKTDGMFLLARLFMESLENKHHPAHVKQALKDLPVDLDHTYDEAVERINGQNECDRGLAYRILSWLTFARRPLSVEELQCALAVDPEMKELNPEMKVFEDSLISFCADLVVIDEQTRIIRLVHHTTQVYLEKRWLDLFPDAQNEITRTCLAFLLQKDLGCDNNNEYSQLNLLLEDHPFLDYAARYWGYHARGDAEEIEQNLLLEFLGSSHRVRLCSQILLTGQYWGDPPSNISSMHLCAFFGLRRIIKHQLKNGAEVDSRDSRDRTPLFWVAKSGCDEGVNLLLECEAVDVNAKDNRGWTPLSVAASNGHDKVVTLLLAQEGINVNSRDSDGWTPLSRAAWNGHAEMVVLLLAHKATDVNTKDDDGQTPLALAAWEGHGEVVSKLLAHDALEVDSKNNDGRTALSLAAWNGRDGVVKLLLDRCAVESKDDHGRTPLSLAALEGHDAIVRLLLDRGPIDIINSRDSQGRSMLHLAACNGHVPVVSMLLERDAVNANSKDLHGRTPLFLSAENGDCTISSLLLGHQAIDVNSKDSAGQTPLLRAASEGHDAAVKLLLDCETVQVDCQDDQGRTALSLAACNGHDEVACLLLDRGVIDVNCKDKHGQTAISLAKRNGHEMMVEVLVAYGAHEDIEHLRDGDTTGLSSDSTSVVLACDGDSEEAIPDAI